MKTRKYNLRIQLNDFEITEIEAREVLGQIYDEDVAPMTEQEWNKALALYFTQWIKENINVDVDEIGWLRNE